jgi:lysyl-tRNA synthetase, class I
MHWADKIAEELIKRHPKKEVFHCASGISPSGPVHVGNLRDILTIWFVGKCLEEQHKRVVLFHSWDDYDRFRKVPIGVPESYKEFIGKPLSRVPDPSGRYESYAARHEHEFEESLLELGIGLEFRYQTKMYESGVYREGIIAAVRARKTIYDILTDYRTQGGSEDEREKYFPITIYCEHCVKDTTDITAVDPSERIFSYWCSSCKRQGMLDLNRSTNVKLPWKVDWAMRWRHERVDFEPGGKDHATAGGSYEVSSRIAKEVFDFEPPVFQPYEFIGLRGLTGKMSGSSGQLVTPRNVLQIYQPEVLLWIFARTPPTRAFDLVVDDQIHRIYEEFDRNLQGSKLPDDHRAMSLARANGRKVHPVPFRQLTSFSGIVQRNHGALERIFDRMGTPYRQEEFEERLQKAENWLEFYAPDQRTVLRSERDDDYFRTLAPQEKDWINELYRWLKEVSKFSVEEATEKVYAIPKKPEMSEKELASAQRRFFQIVYNLLFGKDKGPRLGTFLAAVPREQYLDLLNFTDSVAEPVRAE